MRGSLEFGYSMKMRGLWIGLGACLALGVAGCGRKPPPDPNDPSAVGILQPEVLQRNLKWASEMVNDRVDKGEITDKEGQTYLTKYANELTDKVDLKLMNEAQAWQYADVFRTAQRWELAKQALEVAVKHASKAKNEDRRVNDSLRLAQTLAHLKQPKEAIALARSVFDVRPRDKAPILLSVAYEIVPALKDQHVDKEAAKLLEDAIAQHEQVEVDPKSDAGKTFLAVKWHHIRKAWDQVVDLYRVAGDEAGAQAARQRALEMLDRGGSRL